MKAKCAACGNTMAQKYNPMEQWKIEGPICGDCYSSRINDHYPGDHTRVNGDPA